MVRTNFSADFGTFAIFDRNFAKIVAPPSDECENCVVHRVHLKEESVVNKTLKTSSKSDNKQQRNACSNYAPLERTVLRTRSVTKTPHFGTYNRRAIFPKLCMVKTVKIIFRSNAWFFLQGARKNSG